MLTPSELRGAAFEVLEQALKSENWKEQLTAARIVLAKVDGGDEIDEFDVYETAVQHYNEQQQKRRAPNDEE